jgi:SAM dependent carboxyl methyltransferase
MQNESGSCHGVMEGGGSYNRHAAIPAGGAMLALPMLTQAVESLTLDGDRPVVIADYGSSQGKNSLAPMRAAIAGLRARVGRDRPIVVVHVDQESNDFNTLFKVLHGDPERYAPDDPNVFPSAIGRSFYKSVLPPDHVHLGWSSYAAVWLSRIPGPVPGHFVAIAASGEAGAAFERQAAEDWASFLALRVTELRPGGRLIVVLPGRDDDGTSGFDSLFGTANRVLGELVDEGTIKADERARMVLATFPRRRRDLLAPFSQNGQFRGLRVEHCGLAALPDAAWADYERDGDKETLATRHARFFRAVFAPSLSAALNGSGNGASSSAFSDRLEQVLARRLMSEPEPIHSFVQTMVLAKRDCP